MRVLLAAAAAAFAVSAAAEPPPLEAFARLPVISAPTLSPDGKHIAYFGERSAGRRIVVEPVAGGRATTLDPGHRKPRGLIWAGPRHLLAIATVHFAGGGAFPPQELSQALSLDIVERKSVLLMTDVEDAARVINSFPVVMSHQGEVQVYVEGFNLKTYGTWLYRADPATGRAALVDKGTLETLSWVVRPSGEMVAKAEGVQGRKGWVLKVRRGGGWAELATASDPQRAPALMGLGRDGASILLSRDLSGAPGLFEVSPETGAWSASLLPPGAEPSGVLHDAQGRALGAWIKTEPMQFLAFDPALDQAWAMARETFNGQTPSLRDATDDAKHLVLEVNPPDKSPAFYHLDTSARRASLIGEQWPDLGPLGPTRALTVRAGDGRELSAFLTTPAGREARATPLVVLVGDGGPETAEFDWWTQALASRGYAVLKVNRRGISGLGEEHRDAGRGEFGGKMLTDISDAVRQLAAEGKIDPARVCIAGRGWGGYAAVAGVTLQQGVYRCAVAVNALLDLPRDLREARRVVNAHGVFSAAAWRGHLGVSGEHDPKLAAITPFRQAARASAPVLMIHGEQDTTYDPGHSQTMHKRLKAAGRASELVLMPQEDHWLSRPEGRLRTLEETLRFLARENPA